MKARYPYRALLLLLKKLRGFAVAFFLEVLGGDEAKGSGVDAVAKAGRLGAVLEDVAEVGVA